jgi:hypothetical protein
MFVHVTWLPFHALLGLGEPPFALMRILLRSCANSCAFGSAFHANPTPCGVLMHVPNGSNAPWCQKGLRDRVGWAEMAVLAYARGLDGPSSPTDYLALNYLCPPAPASSLILILESMLEDIAQGLS